MYVVLTVVSLCVILLTVEVYDQHFWDVKQSSNKQASISQTSILLQVLLADICKSGNFPLELIPTDEVAPLVGEYNLQFYSSDETDDVHVFDHWGSAVKVFSCESSGCIGARSMGTNQMDDLGGGDDIVVTVLCSSDGVVSSPKVLRPTHAQVRD